MLVMAASLEQLIPIEFETDTRQGEEDGDKDTTFCFTTSFCFQSFSFLIYNI